jgi:hypothetical protein
MLVLSNGLASPAHVTRAGRGAEATQSEASEQLISRKALAARWQCSAETIKRRTREGLLHPLRFNQRMIRYRLSEVIGVEQQAAETAA